MHVLFAKNRWLAVTPGIVVTAGNALLDTTTANAFAAPVGVDLTAYQDGKHVLALYQAATGKLAWGWISATAPGGEATPTDAASGWNLTNWDAGSGTTINDANTFTTIGTYKNITKNFSLVPGGLYKMSLDASNAGGSFRLLDIVAAVVYGTGDIAGIYRTSVNNGVTIQNVEAGINDVTTLTLERVTDCAATGALILAAKAGARGWNNNGIDPNAAMTYKVFYTGG